VRRKSLPSQTATQSEEEKLIEELAGLTDISMKREALGLCRRFLRLKWISPDGFFEVVRVIGMFGSKKRWAPRLEAALVRQSARIRRALQGTMLTFYAGFGDWENALRFASLRRDLRPHEIAFAIETFAKTGRTHEVRRLGRRIERSVQNVYELSNKGRWHDAILYEQMYLLYGLGLFKVQDCYASDWFSRQEAREEAVEDWLAVFVEHPLGPVAGYNAIDLLLCIVLEKVNRRIREIEEMRKGKCDATELCLSGNQEGLNDEMLRRFNRCRRALERLVPEKRRKELGMDHPFLEI